MSSLGNMFRVYVAIIKSIVFSIVLLLSPIIRMQAFCEDLQHLTTRVSESVVYISIKYYDKNTQQLQQGDIGTGVIISASGDVLTAKHVLKDWMEQSSEDKASHPLFGKIGTKYAPTRLQMAVQFISINADYAILRLLGPPTAYHYQKVCYENELRPGSPVSAFGFPNDHDLTPVSGTYSNNNNNENYWEVAAAFDKGMSGGPVYDSRDDLVGIVEGGVGDSAATRYVTPIKWMKSAIEDYTSASEQCGPSPALPPPPPPPPTPSIFDGVSVVYYSKPNDADVVRNALRASHIPFSEGISYNNHMDQITNALACGSSVSMSVVKKVAASLTMRGIKIQELLPMPGPTKARILEVLNAFDDEMRPLTSPAITISEIDGLEYCNWLGNTGQSVHKDSEVRIVSPSTNTAVPIPAKSRCAQWKYDYNGNAVCVAYY